MKTKIKYAANRTITAGAREMARAYVDEEFKQRQKIYARRMLLAMCIALNDIAGFGDKRLMYILKGVEDITTDYGNRVDKGYRAVDAETDEVANLMQEELLSRSSIHIRIK